ncbi:MAG TPA: galactokinase [Gaiellaceae bacterium]|nr:galactokinase [Gaiellaceae bacterium]
MPSAALRIANSLPGPEDARWFRAPGRVNLIGDHTDYNDGFVLPMAIDRECVVAARPAETVRVASLEMGESVEVSADGSDAIDDIGSEWGRLVAAVVHELAELGRPPVGMDAAVASDVPIGAGLSSSAAFEVACAVTLAGVADWSVEPTAVAAACRAAEERATGVPCGIMDQLIVVSGRAGCAQLIDCRTNETQAVPLPSGIGVLVVHSGQERTLAATAYAERRRECEALARKLGVPALRDAMLSQVADDPLGRHVVTENARVLEAVDALEQRDLEALGRLMTSSHESLRDDYRVSTRELDILVDELRAAGAHGARLTGAGFGGAAVAACDAKTMADVAEAAATRYRARTGLEPRAFACRAVDGAGERRVGSAGR